MKIKERVLSLLLSMVMVLTFMPALAFAGDDPPELLPGTIWLDCEYSGSPDFTFVMDDAQLIEATSSDQSVIKVEYDEGYHNLYDFTLEPIKTGTSTITVRYKLNGVERTTSALYTVKPFPSFVSSLSIDGINAGSIAKINYYTQHEYEGTNPVIKLGSSSGWTIQDGYYFVSYGNNVNSDDTEIDIENVQNGVSLSFPSNAKSLHSFYYFKNAYDEEIMFGVALYREKGEEPYGPDYPYGDDEFGIPQSAVFTLGEGNPELWGVTGSTEVQNIYEPGNKFTVAYSSGSYSTVDFICVETMEDDGCTVLGFYPFGDTSYYDHQLYPSEDSIVVTGNSVLRKGTNNAKVEASFNYGDLPEPLYADIQVTGYGEEGGDHVHQPSGTIIDEEEGTCIQDGSRDESVYCTICNELIYERHVNIGKGPHILDEVPEVNPTYNGPGVQKHYKCSLCDRLFSDEEGKNEIEAPEPIPSLKEQAEIAADAADEAENDAIATEGSADDKKASEAVNKAGEAVAAADAAEKAANDELNTLINEGASDEEIAEAQKTLAEAKAVTVAAYRVQASAKKSAAKVAANRAAAASAAAQNASNSAVAEQYRQQAAAEAAKATNLANDAQTASDAAQTKADEISEMAEGSDDLAAIASAAQDVAGETEQAVEDANTASGAAHQSATNAQQAVDNKKKAEQEAAAAAAASAEINDLPAVKITKPKAAKKKLTVKWKKVSKKNLKKISGIQIQVATDPGFTNIVKTATVGKKKTSKKIGGLQSKTKYYVRIRAYGAVNHYSVWKSKSAKVK